MLVRGSRYHSTANTNNTSEGLTGQPIASEMTETTSNEVKSNVGVGASSSPDIAPTNESTVKNGESSNPKPKSPAIPLSESLLQRVSTIKEGDNVLLRMPSDMVKAVVASKDG